MEQTLEKKIEQIMKGYIFAPIGQPGGFKNASKALAIFIEQEIEKRLTEYGITKKA